MTKFEQDGVEFEFVRWGRPQRKGEYYLSIQGKFMEGQQQTEQPVFHKVCVRHTIGGVEFEETGDLREPRIGEWWISKQPEGVGFWKSGVPKRVYDCRVIIRPVGLKTHEWA